MDPMERGRWELFSCPDMFSSPNRALVPNRPELESCLLWLAICYLFGVFFFQVCSAYSSVYRLPWLRHRWAQKTGSDRQNWRILRFLEWRRLSAMYLPRWKSSLWPAGFPVTHFHPRGRTGTHLSDVKSNSNFWMERVCYLGLGFLISQMEAKMRAITSHSCCPKYPSSCASLYKHIQIRTYK